MQKAVGWGPWQRWHSQENFQARAVASCQVNCGAHSRGEAEGLGELLTGCVALVAASSTTRLSTPGNGGRKTCLGCLRAADCNTDHVRDAGHSKEGVAGRGGGGGGDACKQPLGGSSSSSTLPVPPTPGSCLAAACIVVVRGELAAAHKETCWLALIDCGTGL